MRDRRVLGLSPSQGSSSENASGARGDAAVSGLVITRLEMVTGYLPMQWRARTLDGRSVYIRYKHGMLSVNVGPVGGSIDDAVSTPDWYSEQVAGDHDDIALGDICRLADITVV